MKKIVKFIIMIVVYVTITCIFSTSVNALENTELPKISISLNGVKLSKINKNSKDIKYGGNSLTLDVPNDSTYNFSDSNIEIKGRGNFSWTLPKKSYQIKLNKKVNVLGMGKAKTWVLIANYADNTMMRNKLIYDLAIDLNMQYVQNSKWVNLYVDNEYQGIYLLSEKIQVNDNRIELNDLSGVLIEMDNNYYASETYFKSSISGSHFVLKDSVADDIGSPNSQSEIAFNKFKNYINDFETLLYSENKNWDQISSMIDVESFIKYYFLQEFSENADGARTSVFMYKNGDNDVLHMGPVWDFDLALANCDKNDWGGNPEYDYIMYIKKYMTSSIDWYTQLFEIPEFRNKVVEIYNNEVKNVLMNTSQKINEYKSILTQDTVSKNFNKWKTLGKENAFGSYRGHYIKNTYNGEVNYLSNWISKRISYMNNRYSNESNIVKIKYASNIQSVGWQSYKTDNEISGTEGRSLRVEAIKINLDTFNQNLSNDVNIKYQVNVQDRGWMDWKQNGEIAGTIGQGLRIEAIKIQLENTSKYSIQYRVHVQNKGWLNWVKDGEIAGTTSKNLRIEAIQIKLVKRKENELRYSSHIQNVGWQESKTNNEISGTEGKSLRLEAFKINILNKTSDFHIKYSSYNMKSGWEEFKYDDEIAGTTGQSLKLGAIKIELEGADANRYNIVYRVHVQNKGWLNWVKDGEIAGTTSKNLRIEAIQIKLVKRKENELKYSSHIQDIGWQGSKTNNEISGTEGRSLRLEAFKINILNKTADFHIKYSSYNMKSGWEEFKYDDEIAGTTGQSLKLGAIKIELEGADANRYNIVYRVHIENIGWTNWKQNGEIAGTTTKPLRLEAIQIKLEKVV